MAVNKVVYGGETLVDLSDATVTPDTLAAGATAYNAAGVKITGTMEAGEAISVERVWEICGYVPNGGLPDAYTALSYIQSDGTQYIDTGFKPNGNSRVAIDIAVTSGMTSFLFGARNTTTLSTSNSFSFPQINGSSLRSDYGSVENAISVNPLQRLSIDKNKNVTTVNGTTVTASQQTFQCNYNLFLFSINTAGNKYDRQTVAKLYSCKIYDNGALVRDFVPCRRNSDSAVGLYDKVNSVFYANAGTGSFVAGAVVA